MVYSLLNSIFIEAQFSFLRITSDLTGLSFRKYARQPAVLRRKCPWLILWQVFQGSPCACSDSSAAFASNAGLSASVFGNSDAKSFNIVLDIFPSSTVKVLDKVDRMQYGPNFFLNSFEYESISTL